jgi:HAD superfamily hydrolase (TIGR01490 family)
MPQRKFAAFDIDGTLFRWQLFHEFVFALKDGGFLDPGATQAIDDSFLDWTARKIPFTDYEKTVVAAFKSSITTLSTDDLEKISDQVVKKSSHKVYKFTREYIRDLKKQGYFLLAITGSHQEIAQPFAEMYGFDDCIGAIIERKGTSFTGDVSRYTYGRKDEIIKEYAKEHNLTFTDSVVVGDSEGDISMLALAEKPIAFNPTHELMTAAIERGWEIVVERKNVAYRLRGEKDGTYLLAEADQL